MIGSYLAFPRKRRIQDYRTNTPLGLSPKGLYVLGVITKAGEVKGGGPFRFTHPIQLMLTQKLVENPEEKNITAIKFKPFLEEKSCVCTGLNIKGIVLAQRNSEAGDFSSIKRVQLNRKTLTADSYYASSGSSVGIGKWSEMGGHEFLFHGERSK